MEAITTDMHKQASYGLHNEEEIQIDKKQKKKGEDFIALVQYKGCVGHTLVPDFDDPAGARLASLEKLHSLAMAAL